jgi:hypothetical protein
MQKALLFVLLMCIPSLGQETFRLTVLGYQWTTSHRTLTFSWPGHANTSCNGMVYANGVVSGNNVTVNGTSSDNCSTTFTPPSNQNIEVMKPVVYILAESETSRMVLTCTRNVRWSQCHALDPGAFMARLNSGHFEVSASTGKKDEWVKFDVVQQTAITHEAPAAPSPGAVVEAVATIESPKEGSAPTTRWKSLTSGAVRTLRFEGDYIYGETILPEAAVKAGEFFLLDIKKDGNKYVGKINGKIVSTAGQSCQVTWPVELTLVTPDRIEGRGTSPPTNAKFNWSKCEFVPAADWVPFTWIPVR